VLGKAAGCKDESSSAVWGVLRRPCPTGSLPTWAASIESGDRAVLAGADLVRELLRLG